MSFESIPSVKVPVHSIGQTFVFGDFFSVYLKGETTPRIYNWSELVSVTETKREFIFTTNDATYKLPKDQIPDTLRFLRIRAIVEGMISVYPHISFRHTDRILPAKNYFMVCETPSNAFAARGIYNEREIAYSNVTLTNTRLNFIFRLIGILVIVATFIFLCVTIGNFEDNLWYFLPISIFTGVIAIMMIYLVSSIIAKYIYASLLKLDPSLLQEITFVLCDEGFAAVESCVYTGSDLISWSEAAYFVETNYVYIIFKNKKAVFWLPKRLFSKDIQRDLSNFIASRLQQK